MLPCNTYVVPCSLAKSGLRDENAQRSGCGLEGHPCVPPLHRMRAAASETQLRQPVVAAASHRNAVPAHPEGHVLCRRAHRDVWAQLAGIV